MSINLQRNYHRGSFKLIDIILKISALIQFFQFLSFQFKMSKESPSSGVTNPMLYDPIPEGSVQTSKTMQFVAASAGNLS